MNLARFSLVRRRNPDVHTIVITVERADGQRFTCRWQHQGDDLWQHQASGDSAADEACAVYWRELALEAA